MFKKLLAGLTTIVLSLGLVALTAAPASAHHSDVSATFTCTGPDSGTITWSVHNWDGGKTGRVESSTNGIVPAGTEFASDETKTFTQSVTSQGTYSLSVTMRWWNGGSWANQEVDGGSIQVKKSDFANCDPNESQKVDICHANNGSKGWTSNNVSVSSIINLPNGHKYHEDDIIPPFTYSGGSFPGLNWDAYGQWVWSNGCSSDVTPAAPTFKDAVCTGPGTYGQGSYTIPATTGVRYLVKINGGSWTEKTAGTYQVAVGTDVDVKAEAISSDYTLKGKTTWSAEIDDPDESCDQVVTPTKPDTTQAVCTAEGQVGGASYTIPSITGVKYEKWSNGDWTTVAPGTYQVSDGTTVRIRAVELNGYELDGDDSKYKWDLEFPNVIESKCVVPVNPTPTYSVCTTPGESSQASYVIPTDNGIQYQRWNGSQWVDVSAASIDVNSFPTTVQLRAVAKSGFTLVGGPYEWTFEFTDPGACLWKVTPATPSAIQSVCEANTTGSTQGGYFIATTANVSYTVSVNGATAVPATTGVFAPTNPGDVVVITATPATGYVLDGADLGPWTYPFADPGDCLDEATPVKATFLDAVCEAQSTGETTPTFTVTAAANVSYEISYDAGDTWAPITAGTHDAAVGESVIIRAVPAAGYKLAGSDLGPWSHTFADPGDCLDLVTATPATDVDEVCTVGESGNGSFTSGYLVIPNSPHVDYFVDGSPITAGNHDRVAGTYVVTAVAQAGYKLDGDHGPWSLTITAAEPCGQLPEHPVVEPRVTFTQTTCSVAGSYTLAVDPAEESDGVIWTVSGGLPNTVGTHSVTKAGTVTITATPAEDYGFPEIEGEEVPVIEWSYDFADLPDDCLPTLALTGAAGGVIAGWLGLGTVLTIAGVLLVAARKREGLTSER